MTITLLILIGLPVSILGAIRAARDLSQPITLIEIIRRYENEV